MVIFRENTEDIYAGIEYKADSDAAKKLIGFLQNEMGVQAIRFPNTSGIGIKPISAEGTQRLVRSAIEYALARKAKNVTLVHKGNIMKFTEGAFRDWGYQLARDEFGAVDLDALLALEPDGTYLMQDIQGSSHHHENIDHPGGPLLYMISCMHCMTVSLAQGGDGLGAMWGEQRARELLAEAGFASVDVHLLEHDPFNAYFVVRP